MGSERIKFEKYTFRVKKALPCPRCRKKVRRTTTFEGTANPFTRPPFMTSEQMETFLQPQMDTWLARAEKCVSCRDVECAATESTSVDGGYVRAWCRLDTGHEGNHLDEKTGHTWGQP